MTPPKSLCYHHNSVKCELFRDILSYAQMFCLRLSIPEKILSPSEMQILNISFGKDGLISAVVRIRTFASFQNADKLPHRRNSKIKSKDGNVRLVCSIPVKGKDPGHFLWKTSLFKIEVQISGNTALIPIVIDGHKYH